MKLTKLDMIWFVPEIIGLIAIILAATNHLVVTLDTMSLKTQLFEVVFQLALVLIVIEYCFKWLSKELGKVKKESDRK